MYLIKRQKYREDPNQKLGGGSEGSVYPFPDNADLCVKLFHPPDPDDAEAPKLARYRAEKIGAICKMPLRLPKHFIIPKKPTFDTKGEVSGFLMQRVPTGFVKIMELLKGYRTTHDIGLREITRLFAGLFEDAILIHQQGLVIGDINTGCIMINPKLERAWVDTDSWGYPNFPCLATTEMFAHPDLYPNLESGGNFVPHQPHHDLFSFAVMYVLMALQGAHPFRMGLHPTVRSLQERATGGITIFDPDVTYPKMLTPPEVLSDDMLNQLVRVLKRQAKDPIKPDVLLEFEQAIVVCPQCNIQHHASRKNCPKCHEKTVIDLSKLVAFLIDEEVFKAPETVLFVQVIGNLSYLACRINDKLNIITIDPQKKVTVIPTNIEATKGARYRFFDSCLVICKNPYAPPPVRLEMHKIVNGRLRELGFTTTGALENDSAVFNTSNRFLYRTAGSTIMCSRPYGRMLIEQGVAQVHKSQSWLTVDRMSGAAREALFGYDRALREYQWFVIHGSSDGNRFSYHDVKLPSMRSNEKLEDFTVYFNAASVLLIRKTRYREKDFVRYSIIGLDGKVQKDVLLKSSDEGYDCWENLSGKLFQKSGVLHVTPNGIVKQTLADDTYMPLGDTSGVITITDRLFRFGKAVGVARTGGILTITRK